MRGDFVVRDIFFYHSRNARKLVCDILHRFRLWDIGRDSRVWKGNWGDQAQGKQATGGNRNHSGVRFGNTAASCLVDRDEHDPHERSSLEKTCSGFFIYKIENTILWNDPKAKTASANAIGA